MDSRDQEKSERDGRRTLELTELERELLLRACQRYRSGIPAYLKSREEERSLLDAILARLS